MAPKVKVQVDTEGEDLAGGILKSVDRLKYFGGALQTIGAAISGTVLAPFAFITAPALAAAARHRDATNRIRSTTGATGAALAGLESTYEDVRRAARAGTTEAADAVAALTVALNISGKDLKDSSASLIKLARGAGGDVRAAASTVTRTLRAFGVESSGTARAIDALRGAAQFADGGVTALTSQLASAAPTFKAAGLTLEQSAAMLTDLARRGVPTEEAVVALQRALLKLTKEGAPDAGRALFEHIRAIRDAGPSARAASMATDLFGKRALLMADAIHRGALDLDRIREIAAHGPVAVAAGARLGKSLTDLQIALEQALLPLGQAIERLMLPAMRAWFAALGELVDVAGKLSLAFVQLPDWMQEALFVVLGLAALAGPVLLMVGPVVVALAEVLAVGVAAIGGVGLVVAALTLLIGGAFVAFSDAGDDLSGAVVGAAESSQQAPDALAVAGGAIAVTAELATTTTEGVTLEIAKHATGTGTELERTTRRAAKAAEFPKLTAPQLDGTPLRLPEVSFPELPELELPAITDAPWQQAYKWAQAFEDALKLPSPVGFGMPSYVDVKTAGAAATGGDAVQLLRQIGTLKGVRFSEDPARLEAELARAMAMLTTGDSMRLHAMAMAAPYAALMASLVGPAGEALVGNSPTAWLARADELDRLAGAKAERDSFFIDQWKANQNYWSGYASERDAYWVGQAEANQYALTMAGIRPGVYLPGDIVSAAQQGWQEAARSNAGSFGSQPFGYAPPPPAPPPPAPKPATRTAAAPAPTFSLRAGRASSPLGPDERPARSAGLPNEVRDVPKLDVEEIGGPGYPAADGLHGDYIAERGGPGYPAADGLHGDYLAERGGPDAGGADLMRFWGAGSEFWNAVKAGANEVALRQSGGWKYFDPNYRGNAASPVPLVYRGEEIHDGRSLPSLYYADGSQFPGDPIDEVLIVRAGGDRR